MAGTTNPADHQTGVISPMTSQKDLHQEAKHPNKPIGINQPQKKAANVQATENLLHLTGEYRLHLKESPMQAKVKANIKAVLPAEKRKVFHHANHIPAGQPIVMVEDQQAAVNHTQVG